MDQVTNIIYYDAKLSIDGQSYACTYVNVEISLNKIPQFNIVIQETKDNGTENGSLQYISASDIQNLGKKFKM